MPQYVSRHVFVSAMLLSVVTGAIAGGAIAFVVPYFSQNASSFPAIFPVPETMTAGNEEESVISVIKRTSSAVVAITASRTVSSTRVTSAPLLSDPTAPFPSSQNNIIRLGAGSGFFVSADGMLVTNRHVVDDARANYTVTLQDGTNYPAKVLDMDPSLDLAVLKIDITNAQALELGDSDTIEVGQTVLAIGNALAQFQNSVTKGIISGKNRHLIADGLGGAELLEEAIQTDAAINPGNSGGPLLNLQGQVIGVNTAVSESGQSLGFAIPVNAVKQAVNSVKKTGRIIRPWLGVRYFMIDEETAKRDNLPVNYGALVSRGSSPRDAAVLLNSPADKAGIKENDIILEIQGKKLSDERSLATALGKFAPGDEIAVKVLRQNEEKNLTLKLEERSSTSPR